MVLPKQDGDEKPKKPFYGKKKIQKKSQTLATDLPQGILKLKKNFLYYFIVEESVLKIDSEEIKLEEVEDEEETKIKNKAQELVV